MIATELADHPSIRHTVYLTAFWPPVGATMSSMLGEMPGWIHDNRNGSLEVSQDPAVAGEALAADLDEAKRESLLEQLRLQSAASFGVPSTGKQHTHPTTYVICDQDQAIPPQAQEEMSEPADTVLHLDARTSRRPGCPRPWPRFCSAPRRGAGRSGPTRRALPGMSRADGQP